MNRYKKDKRNMREFKLRYRVCYLNNYHHSSDFEYFINNKTPFFHLKLQTSKNIKFVIL